MFWVCLWDWLASVFQLELDDAFHTSFEHVAWLQSVVQNCSVPHEGDDCKAEVQSPWNAWKDLSITNTTAWATVESLNIKSVLWLREESRRLRIAGVYLLHLLFFDSCSAIFSDTSPQSRGSMFNQREGCPSPPTFAFNNERCVNYLHDREIWR